MAAGLLVVAVEGGPSQGGGSGEGGELIQSVPEVRCDEERAGVGGAEMDWSVAAVTVVWGEAEGSGPDWLETWAVLGPEGGGVGTAVGDS